MMKSLMKALVVVLVAAALANTPAAAKSYLNFVTIAGPDWFGEIELRGSEIPESLSHGGFFNPQEAVSPPANLGRGYLITRGFDDGPERRLFDRLMYFPGDPGYVYYLEIVDGYGPSDGRWFLVDDGHGEELLTVLESKGVYFSTQNMAQTEVEPAILSDTSVTAMGLAAVGLAGVALGWFLRVLRDCSRLASAT